MPGGRTIWMPKKVGELVTIPFDFAGDLDIDESILTAVVTASVYSGIDSNPSAIIFGSAAIDTSQTQPTRILQSITGGVLGTIYGLLCRITTSSVVGAGQSIEMSAFCAIETNLP